jgi:hypothetical protein
VDSNLARTSPGWRQWLKQSSYVALVLLGPFLTPLGVAGGEPPTGQESQIKAAFVFNFLKFVEWPAGRFDKTNSPVIVAVVGPSPIAGALEAMVMDRKLNGRQILVKVVDTAAAASCAHLLFLPASEERRFQEMLTPLALTGVLTVGESEPFARGKGMITFVPDHDRVRFEINLDSADRAGLRISAQLLKLARAVRRKGALEGQ